MFRVPPHHEMFQKANDAQLAWYQMQFAQDDLEHFEMLRDVAEHNAMFMNYDGVQRVREARENTNSYSTSDDEFEKLIKEQFGRGADFEKAKAKPEMTGNDYLDMDLDEVRFIPYDE